MSSTPSTTRADAARTGSASAPQDATIPENYRDYSGSGTVDAHCLWFRPEAGHSLQVVSGFDDRNIPGDGDGGPV